MKHGSLNDCFVLLLQDRIKSDDSHSKQNASINRKALELEAKLGETEMQLEVLRRDKKMLLEDLDRSKERERNTSALCEGTRG